MSDDIENNDLLVWIMEKKRADCQIPLKRAIGWSR